MTRARKGATLIELMVVLVILSLMTGVTVMALRVPRRGAPSTADRIADAKRQAIARAEPVRVLFRESGHARMATAFPDGRVIRDHAVTDSTEDSRNDDAH